MVPLDQVERIEIAAAAQAYGGGRIHRRRDQHHHPPRLSKEPVTARATATLGSYGLRQYDAAVALNNQKVGVDAYMQSLRTDGYRDHGGERREGGGGGITLRHDNGSIRLYGNTTTQRLDRPVRA